MANRSFPPGKPFVYAFSSGRLVLLVCMVIGLMAFSLMLGIRIERYQRASGEVAVHQVTIRPPVEAPVEPPKALAETETPAPATVPSEAAPAPPAPTPTVPETAEPSEAAPAPEPAAPAKAATETPVTVPAKSPSKQQMHPAVPQKSLAAPAKSETKPSPAAKPAAAPPTKKPEPIASSKKEVSKTRFAVQISASQDKETSNSQAEQLKKKGFTTYIEEINVPGKGRFYRVLVGPFPTEAEAGKIRSQIAKDSSFAGCYVRSVP